MYLASFSTNSYYEGPSLSHKVGQFIFGQPNWWKIAMAANTESVLLIGDYFELKSYILEFVLLCVGS